MPNVAKNPFYGSCTENAYDSTFQSPPKQDGTGCVTGSAVDSAARDRVQEPQEQLLQERRRLEESMLQSSNSALGLLIETEQVGALTAQKLVRQRQQLKNVDRRLSNISFNMKINRKHLNTMKSSFSRLMSYFGRGKGRGTSRSHVPLRRSESERAATSQPEQSGSPKPSASYQNPTTEVEEELDYNLVEISRGLGRLKDLAQGMGNEIGAQNDLLSTINEKTDFAENNIQHQNRKLRRLLKR